MYTGERGRMRELVAVNRGGVERVWGLYFKPPQDSLASILRASQALQRRLMSWLKMMILSKGGLSRLFCIGRDHEMYVVRMMEKR